MGFTLGVQNAPSTATQWMANCGTAMMSDPLSLAQRWNYSESAPGAAVLDIVCFDVAGYIIQESFVAVTVEDGKDYTFDFTTEALLEVAVSISFASIMPLIVLIMVFMMITPMMKGMAKGFE